LSTRRRRTVTSCDTTAGSKRRRLLFTGDVDEMFNDKKSQRYAKDNRTAFNCTQR